VLLALLRAGLAQPLPLPLGDPTPEIQHEAPELSPPVVASHHGLEDRHNDVRLADPLEQSRVACRAPHRNLETLLHDVPLPKCASAPDKCPLPPQDRSNDHLLELGVQDSCVVCLLGPLVHGASPAS